MVRSAQEEQVWGKEQELSFEHVMLEPLREQNWDLDPSLPNSSHFVISVGQVSRGSRAQACRAVEKLQFYMEDCLATTYVESRSALD